MNRYHDLPARIARIKAHLKTRRGRRDYKARVTLADLMTLLAGQIPSATTRSLDAIYKAFYEVDRALEKALKPHPIFKMIAKEECPRDRVYVMPLEYMMPSKAYCPDCDQLIEITPNGADPAMTNKRQRLVVHKKPNAPELCLGSGKDV